MLLVNVDSGSCDRAGDMHACEVVLNQGAGYFIIFPVNIVGPFDGDIGRNGR